MQKNPHLGQIQDLVATQAGAVVSRELVRNSAGTITAFAFDAGQGLSEHSAPFDAMVQVLEGSVEIRIGGEPYRCVAGDLVLMPANIPHSLSALEPFKMLLTMLKGQ